MKLLTGGILWLQAILSMDKVLNESGTIDISAQWEVLGPFQVGTREATWGNDPLEGRFYGGFHLVQYNASRLYDSSLGSTGRVGWSIQTGHYLERSAEAVELSTDFSFPDIDWTFLQSVYGWAALQYQGWARGKIVVNAENPKTVVLYVDNVLELFVDGKRYFGGDYYANRRAPLILQLEPGNHQLDIRLIRDLRVMGGVGVPQISVKVRVEISSSTLNVVKEKLFLPEMVDGRLVSHLGSVPVRNEAQEWIEILGIESSSENSLKATLRSGPWSLAPGQTRPVSFDMIESSEFVSNLSFMIKYQFRNSPQILHSSMITSTLPNKKLNDPFKMTFFHPSGIVSYAILKSPVALDGYMLYDDRLPVLLNLHGAGLEADSNQVRHQLDSVDSLPAWTLFPTGGSPWSGDDWHSWGFADVDAAVAAIPICIKNIGWIGPEVDIRRWYVSGHSNGGQGTWFILTHQPDRTVAAAPVSGYSSIQCYVPYQFWREMDTRLAYMLQSSLASYRHELLMENCDEKLILQQHGDADDNVPIYHSRRLMQLMAESNWRSQYFELAGKGHWFDGIMTTDPLLNFYHGIGRIEILTVHRLPRFSFVVPNSGDMGSRNGLEVDQLTSPDQLGKLVVARDLPPSPSEWMVQTSNIHRFHFNVTAIRGDKPETAKIDGQIFSLQSFSPTSEGPWFVRSADGTWTLSDDREWRSVSQRFGAQRGSLDAILRTRGRLIIQSPDMQTIETTGQVARNLYQYFGADSQIVDSLEMDMSSDGNIISIIQGIDDVSWNTPSSALQIVPDVGVVIAENGGQKRKYPFIAGLGAIYLQPLPHERLRLVVWGYDKSGLEYAARLVPMLTGVGQSDFIIVSKECWWKGTGGVLAMGFFDYMWNVSQASYLA